MPLAVAEKIANEAISLVKAAESRMNLPLLTVAVLDAGGVLVAAQARRWLRCIARAISPLAKAWGALGMGNLQPYIFVDRSKERPAFQSASRRRRGSGRFILAPGGVLVLNDKSGSDSVLSALAAMHPTRTNMQR